MAARGGREGWQRLQGHVLPLQHGRAGGKQAGSNDSTASLINSCSQPCPQGAASFLPPSPAAPAARDTPPKHVPIPLVLPQGTQLLLSLSLLAPQLGLSKAARGWSRLKALGAGFGAKRWPQAPAGQELGHCLAPLGQSLLCLALPSKRSVAGRQLGKGDWDAQELL